MMADKAEQASRLAVRSKVRRKWRWWIPPRNPPFNFVIALYEYAKQPSRAWQWAPVAPSRHELDGVTGV